MINDSLRRAARRALKPNAIILGAATCLFGYSLAEALRPRYGHDSYLVSVYARDVVIYLGLLIAAVGLATGKALGNLLAAALSGPMSVFPLDAFLRAVFYTEGSVLGSEHFRIWLMEVSDVPADAWLMTAIATAILYSAVAATLRRTPSRP